MGLLLVCPWVANSLDWQQHAWEACVLAHTHHWDGTRSTDEQSEPPGSVTGSDTVVPPTNTDAAVLLMRHELHANDPEGHTSFGHTLPQPMPALRFGLVAELKPCEKGFVLGFPMWHPSGSAPQRPVPTSGDFSSVTCMEDGRWLPFHGLVGHGHRYAEPYLPTSFDFPTGSVLLGRPCAMSRCLRSRTHLVGLARHGELTCRLCVCCNRAMCWQRWGRRE